MVMVMMMIVMLPSRLRCWLQAGRASGSFVWGILLRHAADGAEPVLHRGWLPQERQVRESAVSAAALADASVSTCEARRCTACRAAAIAQCPAWGDAGPASVGGRKSSTEGLCARSASDPDAGKFRAGPVGFS